MIISGYTDVHTAKKSVNAAEGSYKLSHRLDSIVNSLRWFYSEIAPHSDLIVDCGDLTDKDILSSEESKALKDGLSANENRIPEIHIVGNHERSSEDGEISATSLLSLIPHLELVASPCRKVLSDGTSIALIPYQHEVTENMLESLSADILFSHLDIYGSRLNKFASLGEGITAETLRKYFKLVVNGHVHTASEVYNNVYNVGCFTGLSFADNYDYKYPSAFIIDTKSLSFKFIENPYSIRYLRLEGSDVNEIKSQLDSLQTTNNVVQITAPQEMKESLREIMKDSGKVVSSRIMSKISDEGDLGAVVSEISNIGSFDSGAQALVEYIISLQEVPTSKSELVKLVGEITKVDLSEYEKKVGEEECT